MQTRVWSRWLKITFYCILIFFALERMPLLLYTTTGSYGLARVVFEIKQLFALLGFFALIAPVLITSKLMQEATCLYIFRTFFRVWPR